MEDERINPENFDRDDIKSSYEGEKNNDNQAYKNGGQGEEKMRESIEGQEKNSREEAEEGREAFSCQAENNEEKSQSFEAEAKISDEGVRNASAQYFTEYGVSSRSISDEENRAKTVNTGKKSPKHLFTAVAAVCVLLSLVLGAMAGVGVYHFIGKDDGVIQDTGGVPAYEGEEGVVTIIKNNGSVKINKTTYSEDKEALTVVGVVEKAAASVVEVSTLTSSNYGQYVSSGAGSGVIIAVGGGYSYIVTNYHVVGGSDSITVRLTDKREFTAEYIDGDDGMDIAVIKIAVTENIVAAEIGSSSSLRVGEGVVAIGNPLGELGGTVTDGIISALDREITIDGVTMTLLQTNAAVNPGNSGGGLFNMAGELIGIVNAKESAEGIEGLGFAIPIDTVYEDIVDVIEDGYIHGRITFGFEAAYLGQFDAYRYFGSSYAGIYVINAASSDFKQGDRITEVNSVSVLSESELLAALQNVKIGDSVSFRVVRGGSAMQVNVTAKEYIPSGVVAEAQ
ncbi:MAG: trypsin-like peptidase domain-containing protein [Clostridia bacterium]|nr:trypsin-like peptidase domain-containing protein [Clostridia bacterium]